MNKDKKEDNFQKKSTRRDDLYVPCKNKETAQPSSGGSPCSGLAPKTDDEFVPCEGMESPEDDFKPCPVR